MSRSILNQNINGRNILNIKYKNLLDGNAIKISDRNEINVNFITNTSEELTFNDNDLFLASSPDGDNIKYLTGLTIKQGSNNSLIAGDNINFTINGNNRVINVDTALTGITNINTYIANVFEVNNTNQQYLIKDVSLSANSILSVGSNNKISSTTPTTILNNIIAGANLNKANDSNTINLDTVLTSITSIEGTNLKLYSATNEIISLDNSAISCNRKIAMNSQIINFTSATDNNHQILYSNGGGTMDGVLIRGYGNNVPFFRLQATNPSVVNVLDAYPDKIIALKTLYMSGEKISFRNTDVNHYMQYNGGTGIDGVEVGGFGFNNQAFFRAKNTDGNGTVFECFKEQISCSKKLNMNQNPMNVYSAADDNHQVKHSFGVGADLGPAMNGVLIRGIGGPDPFFRLQETDTSGGVNVLDVYKDKIRCLKKLELNQNRLDFTTGGFQYMEFNTSAMDGILLSGYGGGASKTPVFRVQTSNTGVSSPIQLECFANDPNVTNSATGITRVYNKLAVIRSGTLQNDANDIFSIRNTGFCKSIIHSDNGGCELTLRTNNNQATMQYDNNQRLLISTGGQFRTGGTEHLFYNGGSLRLAFQSDTNLVVYDGTTVKFASNDSQNAHSSRDYKKNISDLVESDSINIIKNLNPVSYEYKEKYWNEHDRCNACNCDLRKGFIWESTKPVLPQACRTINMNNPDEETTKTLDLKMVIPDLTKTVQYLLNKIEKLESQINNNI